MQQLFSYINKSILILVALQVLNIGLFAQDNIQYNSSIESENVVNSFTEFIAEFILNEIDSYSENSKNTSHQHHKTHNHFHIKAPHFKVYNCNTAKYSVIFNSSISKQNYVVFDSHCFANIVFDIIPPPPKC
jgi:hypothetical protein